MKTEYVETWSIEELTAKGYKAAQNGSLYLGNAKYKTDEIHQIPLLGKKFKIVNLKDEKVLVEASDGDTFYLKPSLIKTKIVKIKPKKMIFRDEVIIFNGYGFKFPCSMQSAGVEEIKEVVDWINKCLK